MKLVPSAIYSPFEDIFLVYKDRGRRHADIICLMHSALLWRVHRSTPVVGAVQTKRTELEEKDFPGQHMHTALVSVHARQWRR